MKPRFQADADELVAEIPDGASVAFLFGPGAPLDMVRALIRRNIRDLHLVNVPTGDIASDLLIGAGCVRSIETSGVSLGEFGPAPCFVSAVREGRIEISDSTCPAIYSAIQAGEKGLPFLPIRGLIGSDILAHRPDYKVIDNPFSNEDPIVLLPAIRPDYALIHVSKADSFGDIHIGNRPEIRMLTGAAKKTLVTTELMVSDPIAEDPLLAPACVSSLYIDAIATAPNGAWPMGMPDMYPRASDHIIDYARQARTTEGFHAYLQDTIVSPNRKAS